MYLHTNFTGAICLDFGQIIVFGWMKPATYMATLDSFVQSPSHNNVPIESFYQGMTFLSRRNLPVKSEGASVANHVTVSAPC